MHCHTSNKKKNVGLSGKMLERRNLLALWSLTVAFLFLRHLCFECVAKIPADWKSKAISGNCLEQSYCARLDVYENTTPHTVAANKGLS